MAVQYNPSIVTDGLIMYLDAANSRSYGGTGTTWADLSSQANSITLYNGPAYNTTTTPNISFDGTNDYAVDNGNTAVKNLMTSYSFSVSWWAKYNSTSLDQELCWNTVLDLNSGFSVYVSPNTSNGRIWFEYYDSSPFKTSAIARSNLGGTFVGTWNNWVITNSSSAGLIYRNGSLVSTGTTFLGEGLLSASNLPLTIGGNGINYSSNMNLAVFKIYNKTLSASEVLSNYNALRGRFGL